MATIAGSIRRTAIELRQCDHQQLIDRARQLRDDATQLKSLPSYHIDEHLDVSIAIAVEAVRRTLGYELYDVQLYAARCAAAGNFIEMQTGEGKTLVAGVVAIGSALSGQETHVATTNNYLAARDFAYMQPAFAYLDLTAGLLPSSFSPSSSRAAYRSDIVYGPGYQFGFDYLFDQLTLRRYDPRRLGATCVQAINGIDLQAELMQTDRFEAMIVDEVDSVLIDEALTPLILSLPTEAIESIDALQAARTTALKLRQRVDYTIGDIHEAIKITSTGSRQIVEQRKVFAKLSLKRPWLKYVENALQAEHRLHRNVHYVVVDGKIKIVDQFNGRIFEDRHWQSGLHQAVECKEGIELTTTDASSARITRQRYTGQYANISGMSGTLRSVAAEFLRTYKTPTVSIPTHRVCQRRVEPTRFFASWEAKLRAIGRDVMRRHQTGQPILIGTRTIRESQLVAEALERLGLAPVVLNGIQDRDEAEIVAMGGELGQITVATNMAGRGTDIKLPEASKGVGGLHVIATEHSPSNRVDRQLVGRSARQGDPGSAQFFVSAEDDLIINRGQRLARRMLRACAADGETTQDFSREVLEVQRLEERLQTILRQRMVQSDRWLDQARETLFA